MDTKPTLSYASLCQKFSKMSIDDPGLDEAFEDLYLFVSTPEQASKFLQMNTIKVDNQVVYQTTLLGYILSVSSLPRATASQQSTEFFQNPLRHSQSDHSFTENTIGMRLDKVGRSIHKLFLTLLKAQTRNQFLTWLGRCIYTYNDRKKLWNNQVIMSRGTLSVHDGFLMNLLAVMLHLSAPFAGPPELDNYATMKLKLLKIDPRYCKWSRTTPPADSSTNNVAHFLGFNEETTLTDSTTIKIEDNLSPIEINFITECFHGTHQVFTYGFRSIYERFFKLAQTINELQNLYAEATNNSNSSAPREIIQERMDEAMSQFYNLKAILMVPNHVTMMLHFSIATASYLNHLVVCSDYDEALKAKELKTITLETLREKKTSKECLKHTPEMFVENIVEFMIFLKHFNDQALSQALSKMEPIMTLIIVFMGNSSLMKNPHLRARFAEILECLMPHQSLYMPSSMIGSDALFDEHPLAEELLPSLVNVFVSIEMTGEGVQFEQKFSYRRPMYKVIEYLWNKPMHKSILIKLANEAEENIDSARPPLFLRFINLLMNDAIFLLDEALNYMNQLRETENRRKTVEWLQMAEQQRARAEASYSHIGRLARFHNALSLATIGTLSWLTSGITNIFCHPSLVDRIANMLNYFLEHLVGPKQGKFKVHDKNDYEFKPREILGKICKIYVNLGLPDNNPKYREFCTAVSSDGRSYSDNLLPQAIEILYRTGMSSLGIEFESLSKLVQDIAERNRMDEIPADDIPEEFMDPIMSTLMVDPVLLPSQKIVDRSTIARHLLSDQTDPFNRAPMSMEDIIPDQELKSKIEQFLRDKGKARRE